MPVRCPWIASGRCALLLLALSTPAVAQTWQVDYPRSMLTVAAACGADRCTGQLRRFTADIVYDPVDVRNSRFDVSVDVASLAFADAGRDRAALGSRFLDAAKHPHAYFVTTSFQRSADGRVTADGELRLHGVIRPVVLDVAFAQHGATATLDVTGQVQRLAFGIGSGQVQGRATVGKAVTVHGHLLLHRAANH